MNQGRKITGGKYHARRKRRLHEIQSAERSVVLGPLKRKQLRIRSGIYTTILLRAETVNIRSGAKTQPAKIINVEATPQNPFLARQNRLMKGAIIETSLGKARITNRPSREGQVNAVLIK
jgi:small subunit ribosomal protein S8e